MPSISTQKVDGFLKSPRTYPRGGLGFGIGAGAISVTKPSAPVAKNRMNAKGTLTGVKLIGPQQGTKDMTANFQMKSAELKGKSMLEKIKQLALEKCAGDEQKAQEFLEGFYEELLTKSAAFGPGASKGVMGELVENFAGGIGKGLAGVTLGLGMAGLSQATRMVANDRLHNEFTQALAKAIASNPILRQAKKEKVMNYAETIFKFAPHVASDANLLSSILANAIHGEGVDPQTIKTLTDLESRYTMTATQSSFSPKTYV